MLKNIFALSCATAVIAYGMDSEQGRTPTLEVITRVKIETVIKGYTATIPVTNETTIRDIKENLRDSEGIPVNQQRLNTVRSTWFGFPAQKSYGKLLGYSDIRSDALRDNQIVKHVMSQYETDRLELWLSVHAQPQQHGGNQ